MILTYLSNVDSEFSLFYENFNVDQCYFNFYNNFFLLYYFYYTDYNFLITNNNLNVYSKSIINFINQTEDLDLFNNLESITTIYHYSIPNTRLSYPEPFIASPSFMHNDIWFIHILVYQYWLWFVFIFLIVFFFINFISTLRWCNLRIKPRRETRGVSRSKCADLITACVPVSWATSIIVSESADAIDYYDGFGTTEMVVGIRAYQWGWEYYYPKDIDLNYNIKNNYSSFIGNSLKYYKTTDINLKSNNLWKFYQNKNLDSIITPAHLLILPIDNYKLLNFLNFNDIGSNPIIESTSFKKTRMISKTYYSNLINPISNFNFKWKYFSNLILNDDIFHESLYYGLKRQHNFSSNLSILNNQTTFFNLNSIQKWLNFNLNLDKNLNKTFKGTLFFNFFDKKNNINFNLFNFNLFNNNNIGFNLKKFPFLNNSIFNLKKNNLNLLINNINTNNNNINFNLINKNNLNLNNSNFFYLNNQELTDSKNFNNINFILNQNNDLNSFSLLTYNYNFLKNLKNNYNLNYYSIFSILNLNNFNDNKLIKNSLNNTTIEPIFQIINLNYLTEDLIKKTNKNIFNLLNLKFNDENSNIDIKNSTNNHFNFFFNNINTNWRIENNLNYFQIHNNFYLPLFNFYYDYDFRNWQSLELFEDSFWESNFSSYLIDEYVVLSQNFNNGEYTDKISKFYYVLNKELKFKDKLITESLNKFSINNNLIFYFNSFFTEDYINNINLNIINNSSQIINVQSLIDDSYESSKFLNYLYNLNNKNILKTTNNFFNLYPYSLVFDMFRPDYDDFSWFLDDLNNFEKNNTFLINYFENFKYYNVSNILTKLTLLRLKTNFNFFFFNINTNSLFDFFNSEDMEYYFHVYKKNISRVISSNFSSKTNLIFFSNNFKKHINCYFSNFKKSYYYLNTNNKNSKINISNLDNFKNFSLNHIFLNKLFFKTNYSLIVSNNQRFSNHLNLRSSIKNSMVTHNAIQKVFKARFDEGRSNIKLTEFGNFYSKQPYISLLRLKYEKLLGKNKENFFKINLYKSNFINNFNNFYLNLSSLNFYNYDFPFLLAAKSDASRYLWFDWFSKWGFYEIQPSSVSKYAIFGMPYFSKNFEFNSQINENLNETELYFIRLARARKNYLPNWIYSPYFHNKHINWFKKNIFFEIFNYSFNNVTSTYNILNYMNWYWTNLNFFNYNSYLFIPSNSNIHSYTRGVWKPQASIQSYYFSISKLIDILTKREFLYRQLLESNNKIINLPFYLTNSPKNPLISELKSTFLFIDPNIYNSEYSRDIYFNSLAFFNLNLLKLISNFSNNILNLSFLNNYLFVYFFNSNNLTNNNYELYKNQYRPLRKGISNMIRLHATGAIAMPIEIRLQILASSKDVIHSWAIPSAGIKIDCVPGYSSHKVTIFLLSGIFWGQCMEICGRYHHWMPIVIYFMKRDLFFLWCTHFVFLPNLNNNWNINDRQFIDYTKTVSFDKSSWIEDIIN